ADLGFQGPLRSLAPVGDPLVELDPMCQDEVGEAGRRTLSFHRLQALDALLVGSAHRLQRSGCRLPVRGRCEEELQQPFVANLVHLRVGLEPGSKLLTPGPRQPVDVALPAALRAGLALYQACTREAA